MEAIDTSRNEGQDVDIFQLLEKASEKKRREKREQLLKSVSVKEFFEERGAYRLTRISVMRWNASCILKPAPPMLSIGGQEKLAL